MPGDNGENNSSGFELDDFDFLKGSVPNEPKPINENPLKNQLQNDFDVFELDQPELQTPEETPAEPTEETEATPPGQDAPAEDKFYDAKRDFPQADVTPTSYADRVAASQGIVHKFNYLSKIGKDLESVGSSFGAIDLPGLIGDDLSKIEEYQDLTKVSELSDEDAKKVIFELDKAINIAKEKHARVSESFNQEKQKQEISEELQVATTNAKKAVQDLELTVTEDMTDDQLIKGAEDSLQKFMESVDDYIDEHGGAAYNKRLRELTKAVDTIKGYVDTAHKSEQAQKQQTQSKPTPEQIESWYEEFRADNPNLAIFKAPTEDAEVAFIQYVKRQGMELNSPRSFKAAYQKYDAYLQTLRTKKVADKIQQQQQQQTQRTHHVPIVRSEPSKDKPLHAVLDDEMDQTLRQAFSKN